MLDSMEPSKLTLLALLVPVLAQNPISRCFWGCPGAIAAPILAVLPPLRAHFFDLGQYPSIGTLGTVLCNFTTVL